MIRERENAAIPGLPVLLGGILLIGTSIYQVIEGAKHAAPATIIGWILVLVASILVLAGLFVVNPNEGKVLQLFGSYAGTVKRPGLRWANPFYTKKRISQRIRNFESSHLKVNDNEGNPIEIAAVVV
jgi:regulator of protease activity HflC (stomatin/prohibitin superfamily)